MNILAALLLLASQGPRNLLTGGLSERSLAAALIPAARWHPYPSIQDRADWEAVPQEIRAGFIRAVQQYLGTSWERIPATVTLQYIRNGTRSNYGQTRSAGLPPFTKSCTASTTSSTSTRTMAPRMKDRGAL